MMFFVILLFMIFVLLDDFKIICFICIINIYVEMNYKDTC